MVAEQALKEIPLHVARGRGEQEIAMHADPGQRSERVA
jgi:hypothetical protein